MDKYPIGRIEDAIFCLQAGVEGKWTDPRISLVACMDALMDALRYEVSTNTAEVKP